MNVVCVISNLGGGGAERVMTWLIDKLDAHGHKVSLVVRHAGGHDSYAVPTSVSRHVQPPYANILKTTALTDPYNFVRWARHLRGVCRKARADVVLSFIDDMNVFCVLALRGTDIPVVVSERVHPKHSWLTGYRKLLRPSVYRSAAAVVVQTPEIRDYVQEWWRLKRIVVVPNPVRSGLSRVGNTNLENRHVVAVGRLHAQKGHDVLLNAWSQLDDVRRGWTLDIIGEGVEKDRLGGLIEQLGIGSSVCLRGYSPDVPSDLNRASIFALASRYEGFSNAVLEAMATGCAVITTDCPGANRSLIESATNGELVPVDDPAALSAALRRVMIDPALRRRYASAAKRRSADFDEHEVYGLWERTLHSAANGSMAAVEMRPEVHPQELFDEPDARVTRQPQDLRP